MAIFKNRKSALEFAHLYETLSLAKQKEFGEKIREAADTKMMSDESLDDYYLTPEEIASVYDGLFKVKLH